MSNKHERTLHMSETRQPENYPERILALVIGKTPQIVTETVYALAVLRNPPFVPTRVEVLTTSEGASDARLALLHPDKNHFGRLCADYGLAGKIQFDESCIHCIEDAGGRPIQDIRTPEENACAADAITNFVRKLTANDDSAVHVSIAGGRKTMGFYMGYALSLYGRPQDRMSHVLVAPPFEGHHEFFYPPARSTIFNIKEGNIERPVNSDDARIMLAEIPFVPMRHGLITDLMAGEVGFNEAVERVKLKLGPPALQIRFADQTILCGGRVVKLDPQLFSFYAWLAERNKLGLSNNGHVRYSDPETIEFLKVYRKVAGSASGDFEKAEEMFAEERGMPPYFFQEKKSRINKQLNAQLKEIAYPYLIHHSGKRPTTRFGIILNPEQIVILTCGAAYSCPPIAGQ